MSDPVILPAWYVTWANDYATKFFGSEQSKATVLSWGTVFAKMFDEGILQLALEKMLTDPRTPKFLSEHRGYLLNVIESIREAREDQQEKYEVGVCFTCGGTGWKLVPHPGTKDGKLRPRLRIPKDDPKGLNRMLAVACDSCERGRRTATTANRHGKVAITFSRYTEMYPNWAAIEQARQSFRTDLAGDPEPSDVRTLLIKLASRMHPGKYQPSGQLHLPDQMELPI